MSNFAVEEASCNTARDFALAQIKAWHAASKEHVVETHKTPEDALRWFCAYQEATQLHECNMIKDWAGMLMDGIGPMNVEAELEVFIGYIDGDDTLQDGWQKDLLAELKEFFGIEKEDAA